MAPGPIISGEIDGETVETVAEFILGGSKITAYGDYSHEIKRHFSMEGKLWCGCESWAVKKAKRQRIMLLNCGVGEDSWESFGLQEDPTSPF